MSKFSSYKKSQVLFENWRKYIISEDLEVVLTNEEAGELFGEEIEELTCQGNYGVEDVAVDAQGSYPQRQRS